MSFRSCLLHLWEEQAHEFIPPLHSFGPYELIENNESHENVKTTLAEYIKDARFNHAEKKTETEFSSIWRDLQGAFGDSHVKEPFKPHFSVPNPPRDTEFQFGDTYRGNQQQMRKQILQRYSSFIFSTIVFLGILFNIWSNPLSFIQVQSLQKEHNVSIWPSLLGLFSFMVFVCVVALMVLSGATFTSMQKTMIIFLIILMHLQLASQSVKCLFY